MFSKLHCLVHHDNGHFHTAFHFEVRLQLLLQLKIIEIIYINKQTTQDCIFDTNYQTNKHECSFIHSCLLLLLCVKNSAPHLGGQLHLSDSVTAI